MFVSQTAEYALRAMAGLSTVPLGMPIRTADLSHVTAIPPHYLAKVLRRLVLADLLTSQKGQGGGFTLARPAADITLLDILVAVDAFPDEAHCAFGWQVCDADHPCPLHGVWSRLDEHLRDWATSSTLADVSNFAHEHQQTLIPGAAQLSAAAEIVDASAGDGSDPSDTEETAPDDTTDS